jgi:hypothetical protein
MFCGMIIMMLAFVVAAFIQRGIEVEYIDFIY